MVLSKVCTFSTKYLYINLSIYITYIHIFIYIYMRDRFEGVGVTQGWVTFRFLTLKMGHFSKKRHFFTKKAKISSDYAQNFFAAPSAPQNTPHIPIFLRFIAFL